MTETAPSELESQLRQSILVCQNSPRTARRRFRLTAEEHADREMSEKSLDGRVRRRAAKEGWMVVHISPARVADGTWATPQGGQSKGFPDLMLFKVGRPIAFRELKRETEQLTPEQGEWFALLHAMEQDVAVWRPSDLRTGLIDRFLKA